MTAWLCFSFLYAYVFSQLISCENTEKQFQDAKFFLEQSDECHRQETMLEYLNNKSVLKKNEYALINENLRLVKDSVRRRRLQQVNEGIPRLKGSYLTRRALSEQSQEERRDEMISLLNLFYKIRSDNQTSMDEHSFKRQLSLKDDITHAYLDSLNIDIIRNDLLPNDELYNLSLNIPCLKYPPEKDQLRHFSQDEVSFPPFATAKPTTDSLRVVQVPNEISKKTEQHLYIPNDPFAVSATGKSQWHLFGSEDRLTPYKVYGTNLFRAWARYRGENHSTVVAVVDSGCSLQPDLEGNLCKKGDDCEGYDFGDDDSNPFTEPITKVHGTPVSGIIAAVTNNHLMTAGICWNCKIMCLKAYSSRHNALLSTAIVRSLDYILKKKVKLSNHSYVGYSKSLAEMSAIQKLNRAGHLMIVAAGNGHCDLESQYPFDPNGCHINQVPVENIVPASYSYENIIAVGSTMINGAKSPLSNWGSKTVDVMAPGQDIIVPYNVLLSATGVASISGTSAASAVVSGSAALLWSSKPSLTNLEIKSILLSTSQRLPNLKGLSISEGTIDVAAAIEAADGIKESLKTSGHPGDLSLYLSTHKIKTSSTYSKNCLIIFFLYAFVFFII